MIPMRNLSILNSTFDHLIKFVEGVVISSVNWHDQSVHATNNTITVAMSALFATNFTHRASTIALPP